MRIVHWCVFVMLAGSVTLPASAVELSVDGTTFVVRNDDKQPVANLVGAEFELGGGRQLRIDGVRSDPDDAEILLYRFSTRMEGTQWHNPCLPDHAGKQEGFPLPGRWNPSGQFGADDRYFTMTCSSGAYAKCVRFGYKPWKTSKGARSMLPLYESCVRMVRGDYCGDGNATTVDGTRIHVFDDDGIRKPALLPDFRFEAGWSPEGAVCVHHTRVSKKLDLNELVRRCPRLKTAVGKQCDEVEARRQGAILFNKSVVALDD